MQCTKARIGVEASAALPLLAGLWHRRDDRDLRIEVLPLVPARAPISGTTSAIAVAITVPFAMPIAMPFAMPITVLAVPTALAIPHPAIGARNVGSLTSNEGPAGPVCGGMSDGEATDP